MNVVSCVLESNLVEKVIKEKDLNLIEFDFQVYPYSVLSVSDDIRRYIHGNERKLLKTTNLSNRVRIYNFSEDDFSHNKASWDLFFYREGVEDKNIDKVIKELMKEVYDYFEGLTLKKVTLLECVYDADIFSQAEVIVDFPSTVNTIQINNVYDLANNGIEFLLTDLENIDIQKEIDSKMSIYKKHIEKNIQEDSNNIIKSLMKKIKK